MHVVCMWCACVDKAVLSFHTQQHGNQAIVTHAGLKHGLFGMKKECVWIARGQVWVGGGLGLGCRRIGYGRHYSMRL